MSAKERRNGLLISVILIVLELLIGFSYTPILLTRLGESQFGLYQMMAAVVAYLAISDLGLGGTLTRYLIEYRSRGDASASLTVFSMCIIIYAVLASFVIVVSLICIFFISDIFPNLSSDELFLAKSLLGILSVNLCLTLYDHAYTGALHAYEKFSFDKGCKVARVVIRAILVLSLVHIISNAIVIVIVDLMLSIFFLTYKVIYCKKTIRLSYKKVEWDNHLFKSLLLFTSAIFLQVLINQVNTNIGKIILGVYMTPAVVAVYSIALQLYSFYFLLSTTIQSVFSPKIALHVFNNESNTSITERLVQPSRLQFIVMTTIIIPFWFYGEYFVKIWCGKPDAWFIAAVLMTASSMDFCQNCTTSVLKAKKKLIGKTAINAIVAISNILVSLFLVTSYGIMGVLSGAVIGIVFGNCICSNLYYRFIGIDILLFFSKTLSGLILSALLSISAAYLIKLCIPTDSIYSFLCSVILFFGTHLIFIYYFGLNKMEKCYIQDKIISKLFK